GEGRRRAGGRGRLERGAAAAPTDPLAAPALERAATSEPTAARPVVRGARRDAATGFVPVHDADLPARDGAPDGWWAIVSWTPTAPLRAAGNLFSSAVDVALALPRRPFQWRELIRQAWFLASVTIVPTALVAIPFGAVIA